MNDTKTIVTECEFDEAADLADFIGLMERELKVSDPEGCHVMHIEGSNGVVFGNVKLVKTELTDGSFTYDLVIS